jgi:hypothetical protein
MWVCAERRVEMIANEGCSNLRFSERPTCSIDETIKATGLSRSMIYNKMKSGEIEWTKVNSRRLVKVKSLLRLLGVEA